MFGDLTSAFGFTVVLCLAPSLVVALAFPPLLMWLTRPKTVPQKGKKPQPKKRNFVMAFVAFAQFYFVSLIVLVMASILFWWAFIAFSGVGPAADFAAQSFPAQEDELDDVIDPILTTTPGP